MEKSQEFQHGFDQGMNVALALLSKHLEKIPGFDAEKFKSDLETLIQLEQGRSPSQDYFYGFQRPLEALNQKGLASSKLNALDAKEVLDEQSK